MLNQVVICGRIVDMTIIEQTDEKKVSKVKIAVPRSYKNIDGTYDTDFITCTLWNGIAENTMEYCKQGDIVGIKGRIQCTNDEMEIVAEKLSFLSSKKQED
jgi:single-strand DNA-binding protein